MPSAPTRGTNTALLARLAHETGGRFLREPAEAFSRAALALSGPAGAPTGERWDPLWPVLAALALLLFPLDVAIRRLRWPGG
jgi:hypothetical protein